LLIECPTIARIAFELFGLNLLVGITIGLYLGQVPWSWWLGSLVYLVAFGGFKQKFLQNHSSNAQVIVRAMYRAILSKWVITMLLLALIWRWLPTVSAVLLLTSYGFNQLCVWQLPCFRMIRK